jgi:hypothetical protein
MKDFNTTLKKLIEDTEPISVASLFALSAPTRAETEKADRLWLTIPLDRRQTLMQHLVDIAEENFEVDFSSIYRIGLTDPDPQVHATAIGGLWEDTDPTLIAPLIRDLQSHSSELVRAAAALRLGQFVLAGEYEEIPANKIKPVLAALNAAYLQKTEPVEVRRRALEALAYHTSDALPEFIRAAYLDGNERLRISAVQAMGRSADEQWAKIVLDELHSTNPEMRFEAAQACGMLEIPSAVKPLTQLIDDVDDQVQKMAVWSLGQIGGDVARQVLVHVLDKDQDYLTEAADDALAELEFKNDNLDFKLIDFSDVGEEDEDDEEWLIDLLADDEEDVDVDLDEDDEEEVEDIDRDEDDEEVEDEAEIEIDEDDDSAQET